MPPKKRKQSPSKSSSKKTKASPQKYKPPALLKDGKVYYPTIEIASRGARNTAKPQSSSTAKVGETKKTKQRTVKKQVIHKHPHQVIYPSRPWMLLPPGVGMPNPASGPFPVPNVAMPAGVVGASNASKSAAAAAEAFASLKAKIAAVESFSPKKRRQKSLKQTNQTTQRVIETRNRSKLDKEEANHDSERSGLNTVGAPSKDDVSKKNAVTTAAGKIVSRDKKTCAIETTNESITDSKITASTTKTSKDSTKDSTTTTPNDSIPHKSPPWYPPTHPYSKFPTLNNLSINILNQSSLLSQFHIENILREVISFKKHIGQDVTYLSSNSRRHVLVLDVPICSDTKQWIQRVKKYDSWMEVLLKKSIEGKDCTEEENRESAIQGLLTYLVQRHKDAVLDSLEDLRVLPITEERRAVRELKKMERKKEKDALQEEEAKKKSQEEKERREKRQKSGGNSLEIVREKDAKAGEIRRALEEKIRSQMNNE